MESSLVSAPVSVRQSMPATGGRFSNRYASPQPPLAPRHEFEQLGKLAHVVDHVIRTGPTALEIRWMELAALHQYSGGSHMLSSDYVSLDVVSNDDRFGRCAPHLVQCSVKESRRRLAHDRYFGSRRRFQPHDECPHVESETVGISVA